MKKYDWILFDADHPLLDFDRSEAEPLSAPIQDFGAQATPEALQTYNRINTQAWADFQSGKISREALKVQRFADFLEYLELRADPAGFGKHYLQMLSRKAYWLPEAENLISEIRQHYRIGLISNGLAEVQRPRFSSIQLFDIFHTVVISGEIGPAKPDPAFFDYTFRQINHPPREKVLVVGDNLHADIGGGNGYGLDTCWYNPGGAPPDSIQPTYEVRDIAAVRWIL